MMVYAPTAIDLSRLPAPEAIESLNFETLYSEFKSRFLSFWTELRATNPDLPEYNTTSVESEAAGVVGEAWSYLRLLDRQNVIDTFKALLAPLATGGNLDALVATRNVLRITITAATANTAAVMEGDASLLRRYLESFDAPAAGSAGRYLFDARTAWPQSSDRTLGLWDARVNGRVIHGRRGDTDLVIIGPFGRSPTTQELATVRAAVTNENRAPEAAGITVMAATRVPYQVSLVIEVPGNGPSADALRDEAVKRVSDAATTRILIGGEIPGGFLSGAAYGNSIIRVRDLAPVVIEADPYSVPVMTGLTITSEVRS